MYKSPFSVIVPAFNSVGTIAASLESVLGQSKPPAQVIVVDDGSTDGTADVAKAVHPSIEVIRQENAGSGAARAYGTRIAVSPWVAYLDADDWWLPSWLEVAGELAKTGDTNVVFCDLSRASPGHIGPQKSLRNSDYFPQVREALGKQNSARSERTVARFEAPEMLALLLDGFPVFPSTVAARREAVLSVGNWRSAFRRCQDFDLWLRLARRYPFHYVDKVHTVLGLHDVNSSWLPYSILQTKGDVAVLECHVRETVSDPSYLDSVGRALDKKRSVLGWLYRQSGDYVAARESYRLCLQARGFRTHAVPRFAYCAVMSWLGQMKLQLNVRVK